MKQFDLLMLPSHLRLQPTVSYGAKLYNLIWCRFMACQMKPAQYAQRAVTIQGGPFTFKVTGSTLIFDGFLKVYGVDGSQAAEKEEAEKEWQSEHLENLAEKYGLDIKEVMPKQHFTSSATLY